MPPTLFCCEGKVTESQSRIVPSASPPLHFSEKTQSWSLGEAFGHPHKTSETATALKEFQAVWGHSTRRHLSPVKKRWGGPEMGLGEASHRLWGTGRKPEEHGEELEVRKTLGPKKTQRPRWHLSAMSQSHCEKAEEREV